MDDNGKYVGKCKHKESLPRIKHRNGENRLNIYKRHIEIYGSPVEVCLGWHRDMENRKANDIYLCEKCKTCPDYYAVILEAYKESQMKLVGRKKKQEK